MKQYLFTLSLLGAFFSFMNQGEATPCVCANNNVSSPQIEGCIETEQAKECRADCDCAPGRKCSVTYEALFGATGKCEPK